MTTTQNAKPRLQKFFRRLLIAPLLVILVLLVAGMITWVCAGPATYALEEAEELDGKLTRPHG